MTVNENVEALLKVFYSRPDEVANLLFVGSPVLAKIKKQRVEGKEIRYSALLSHGACSADYTKAIEVAEKASTNMEWKIPSQQMFSALKLTAKDLNAATTQKGMYMPILANKLFGATDAFRRSLAVSMYGRGYGEVCLCPTSIETSTDGTTWTAGTAFVVGQHNRIELPAYALMLVDIGTILVEKNSISAGQENVELEVTAVDGNKVYVTASAAVTPAANSVLCLKGSEEVTGTGDGTPKMPMGLGGWLPIVGKRTGTDWNTYIGTEFNGFKRSVNVDKLAGIFIDGTAETTISPTIKNLIIKLRRHGVDFSNLTVIMNDEDFGVLSDEIQTTNVFYAQTGSKKKSATVGYNDVNFAFSTSLLDSIVVDPFCPKGRVYAFASDKFKLYSYTNTVALDKPETDVKDEVVEKKEVTDVYQLNFEDYISIQQGAAEADGPTSIIALRFFGTYAMENTSLMGVALIKTFDGFGA